MKSYLIMLGIMFTAIWILSGGFLVAAIAAGGAVGMSFAAVSRVQARGELRGRH